MNIQLRFLQKAIEDKNYISFTYEGKAYKKVKALKIENDEVLKTSHGVFEFSKMLKFIVLKERF